MAHSAHKFVLGLALGALAWGGSAGAEETAFQSDPVAGQIDLVVGKAEVLNFDVAFRELAISDPEIADLSSVSPNRIYLIGKKPGSVTLTLLRGEEAAATNYDVVVETDISGALRLASKKITGLEAERDGLYYSLSACPKGESEEESLAVLAAHLKEIGFQSLVFPKDCNAE